MKDIPTPEHDALFGKCNEKSLLDELCMVYELAQSLEKRLAIAVAALKQSRIEHYACEDDWYSCPNVKGHGKCDCGAEEHNKIINDALAQIEEKK